jgi:hypothetical protein
MQFTGLLLLLILIGTFVLLYGMWLRARRTAQLAALYQRAIEQGMDPRALRFELDEREAGDPQGNLKAGIILLAASLGLVAGLWAAQVLDGPWRAVGFALIPLAIGLACIFIHYAMPRPPAVPPA